MYVKDMPSVVSAACHNEGSDASRDGQVDEDLVLDGVVDDRIAAAYAIVELGERETKKVAEFPPGELDEDLEVDDLDQYHQVPRSPEYCRKDRRSKYEHRSSSDSSPVRTPQKSHVDSHQPRFCHVRGAVMPSRTCGKPLPKLPPKRRLEDEGVVGGIKAKLARMLFEKSISRTNSLEKLPEDDEKETGARFKGIVYADEEQQVESQCGRFVRTSMPLLQPINVISCAQSGARFKLEEDEADLHIRSEQSLSAEEINRFRESLLRKRVTKAEVKEKESPLDISTAGSRVSPNRALRSPSTSPPAAFGWHAVKTPVEDCVIPANSSYSPACPNAAKVQLALSTKDTEVHNLSQFLPQNGTTDYSVREDTSHVSVPPSWPVMSGLSPFLFLGSANESAMNSNVRHGNGSESWEPMVVKTLVPGTGLVQYLVLPANPENSVSGDRRHLKVVEPTEMRRHLDDAMTKLEKFSLGKHLYSGSPSRPEMISSDAGIPYWCLAPRARSFYPQFGSLNSISNYYSVANSPALSEDGLYPSDSAVSRSCHDLTRIPSESPKLEGVPSDGRLHRPSQNGNRYERPKSNESVQRSCPRRVRTYRRKISPVACALEMVQGGEFGSLRTIRKLYSSLKSRNTLNLSEKPPKQMQFDELREKVASQSQNYKVDAQDFPLDLSSCRKECSSKQKVELKRCPSELQSFSDSNMAVPFRTNPNSSSLAQHDSILKIGSGERCSDSLFPQQPKSYISDFSGSRTVEVAVEKSANPSLAPNSLSSVLPNSSLPPKKRKLRQPSQSCDSAESTVATSTTSNGSTLAYRLQTDGRQTMGVSETRAATRLEELDVKRESAAVVSPPEIGFTLSPEMKLLESKVGVRDEDGDLPLHIAVAKGSLEFVQKVLLPMMSQRGVHIDSCNHQRQTALHLAVITNQPRMVETLLKASASAGVCDRKGNTAVHLAIKYKTLSCLRHILTDSRIQIDLDAKNYEGLTALHLGVQLGEREAVKALLANGADPNAMDGTNGRTPLFYAVETNDEVMAFILLKHGSDPCIASYSGCTPLQIATAKSFRNMTNMLEKSSPRGFEATTGQEENFGQHV